MPVDGPRFARPDEFPDLLELCDRCFRQPAGGMADRLPFVYDRNHPERHAIIRQDDQIIAHAAAVPQRLAVDGGEVDCPGIGGVATDPRYRGNGYMTQLLDFWLDHIDAPLVELGGDRERYERFGWENGGREYRYRLTARSAPNEDLDAHIQRYDGRDDQLDTLRRLHAEEPLRVIRSQARSARVYRRRGTETLLVDGDDAAYVSFDRTRSESSLREFGGSRVGVTSLLSAIFDRYALDAISVRTPPHHPLNPLFREWSTYWQVTPLRKLNIRDLVGVLSGFTSQLSARLTDADIEPGRVILGIDDDRASLDFDGTSATVEPTSDTPDISLSRREMVLLLFGYPEQLHTLRDQHPILAAGCPLSYYIWNNEYV